MSNWRFLRRGRGNAPYSYRTKEEERRAQKRTGIPRAFSIRSQWAHSQTALERRERRLRGSYHAALGFVKLFRFIFRKLGLYRPWRPPEASRHYRVEVS
jgi:hypothetical protein